MKEFFDTSVLVAAFWGGHVHHVPSLKRFAAAEKRHSACGIHSLAEVYAVMTALPVKPMIPPEQALPLRRRSPQSADSRFSLRRGILRRHSERRLAGFHGRPHIRFFALSLRRQMQSPGRLYWESQALPVLAADLVPRIQTP